MAAARCKISKTRFLLGLLRGKRWDNKEHKLFSPPEEAEMPQEAQDLISSYRHSMQRSNTARWAEPHPVIHYEECVRNNVYPSLCLIYWSQLEAIYPQYVT